MHLTSFQNGSKRRVRYKYTSPQTHFREVWGSVSPREAVTARGRAVSGRGNPVKLELSMQFFSGLYRRIIEWAKHRHAPFYLAGLSFTESSVFPIPPDFMLAPMMLAKPKKSWEYAFIATLFSTLGGIFGYIIGMFFIKLIYPWIVQLGYATTYQQVEHWFRIWDFWIIFLAGFTPIPYKIFTIAAGAVGMPLFPFIVASFIGRGGRFFLVAALIYFRADKMEAFVYKYIDRAGWLLMGSVLVIYLAVRVC